MKNSASASTTQNAMNKNVASTAGAPYRERRADGPVMSARGSLPASPTAGRAPQATCGGLADPRVSRLVGPPFGVRQSIHSSAPPRGEAHHRRSNGAEVL